MSIHFLANHYPDPWIRNQTNPLSIDDIKSKITIREAGWTPNDQELAEVSNDTGPVNFHHTLRQDSPTEKVLEGILESYLDTDLPVISIINARRLRQNTKGGVHAVVVTGKNSQTVAINDPWGYLYDTVNVSEFLNAWDDTINQYIAIDLGDQQTMSDHTANREMPE